MEVSGGRPQFGSDEYRARVGEVAEGIRRRGLDAVVAWSRGGGTLDGHANVLWLTGYYNPWLAVPDSQCWSGQSYAAVIVTAEQECVLVTNVPESEWAGSGVVCDAFVDEPFIHLGVAGALRARNLEAGRLGLAGREVLSVALHDQLRAALPSATLVAADEVMLDARRPVREAELDVIRRVGSVADRTMEAMLRAAIPGASERDAARAAYVATIDAGGTPYSLSLATGPAEDRYCPSTLPNWSTRTLAEGDLWHVDLAGTYAGYLFDFARTTVVGDRPSSVQQAMMEGAIAIVDAVIARIEPGRPIGDAVAAGHAVQRGLAPPAPAPTKHDYPHLGHTLGLGFGDIWLYENERRPFTTGMYLAVEAVVPGEGHGFAMFEQNLIVGEEGPELVTKCAKRPWEAA